MAVMEMERKVTKVGNSLGITLPPEVLEHAKVKQGDELRFHLQNDGSVLIKKSTPLRVDILDEIDQDFLEGMKDLFNNYDNTLKNLAQR